MRKTETGAGMPRLWVCLAHSGGGMWVLDGGALGDGDMDRVLDGFVLRGRLCHGILCCGCGGAGCGWPGLLVAGAFLLLPLPLLSWLLALLLFVVVSMVLVVMVVLVVLVALPVVLLVLLGLQRQLGIWPGCGHRLVGGPAADEQGSLLAAGVLGPPAW